MSNEAAERLDAALLGGTATTEGGILSLLLHTALAEERIAARKATVERIRAAIGSMAYEYNPKGVLLAILDAEAAR